MCGQISALWKNKMSLLYALIGAHIDLPRLLPSQKVKKEKFPFFHDSGFLHFLDGSHFCDDQRRFFFAKSCWMRPCCFCHYAFVKKPSRHSPYRWCQSTLVNSEKWIFHCRCRIFLPSLWQMCSAHPKCTNRSCRPAAAAPLAALCSQIVDNPYN